MTRRRQQQPSFTLTEVVVASVIVGVMLVAALDTLGAARRSERITSERARGQLLAQELMSEILAQAYEDPTAALPGVLGPEAGEGGSGNRAGFDDVDDYYDWADSPPKYKDGTPLPDAAGWSRVVDVHFVFPYAVDNIALVDLGVKRITVTVKYNGVAKASLVALKTKP